MIFQIVGTLVFAAFHSLPPGDFTPDLTSVTPYCAHIKNPKSVNHIITTGQFMKLMGLKNGKTYNGPSLNNLRKQTAFKHCADWKAYGSAWE